MLIKRAIYQENVIIWNTFTLSTVAQKLIKEIPKALKSQIDPNIVKGGDISTASCRLLEKPTETLGLNYSIDQMNLISI